jgi:hypothetical protein
MNLENNIEKLAESAKTCATSKDALSYSQAALNLAHANNVYNQIELNKKASEKNI